MRCREIEGALEHRRSSSQKKVTVPAVGGRGISAAFIASVCVRIGQSGVGVGKGRLVERLAALAGVWKVCFTPAEEWVGACGPSRDEGGSCLGCGISSRAGCRAVHCTSNLSLSRCYLAVGLNIDCSQTWHPQVSQTVLFLLSSMIRNEVLAFDRESLFGCFQKMRGCDFIL